MKNILILESLRGEFVCEEDVCFLKRLNHHLRVENYDYVVYIKLNLNCEIDDIDNAGEDAISCKIIFKNNNNIIYSNKTTNKLKSILINMLKSKKISHLDICGYNINQELQLLGDMLVNNGIDVSYLSDLIVYKEKYFSCEKIQYKNMSIFYLEDLIVNPAYTDATIISFATLEWLLCSGQSMGDYRNILNYYYKLYPSKIYTYDPQMDNWLANNCKAYFGENFDCLKFISPIAYYSHNINEIDYLIDNCLSAMYGSKENKRASKILCVAIWLLKYQTKKENLLKTLYELTEITIENSFIKNYKKLQQENTIENIVALTLSIFIQNDNMKEMKAVVNKIKINNSEFRILLQYIIDIYYTNQPEDVKVKNKLPQKFANLLIKYFLCPN